MFPGKLLIDELKRRTSWNFGKLCRYLCMTKIEYKSEELFRAIDGLGTDEHCLIDIMCHTSNAELEEIKKYYANAHVDGLMNPDRLKDDIKGDTSFKFRCTLLKCWEAKRDESDVVDKATVDSDVALLYKHGEARWGTDDTFFIATMTSRSVDHLRAVSDAYQAAYGKSLEKAIHAETSGDYCDALVALTKPKLLYFAERAKDAMGNFAAGLGTKDGQLIRVHVMNSKQELQEIKVLYNQLTGRVMEEDVKKETSGDYMKLLLALLDPKY